MQPFMPNPSPAPANGTRQEDLPDGEMCWWHAPKQFKCRLCEKLVRKRKISVFTYDHYFCSCLCGDVSREYLTGLLKRGFARAEAIREFKYNPYPALLQLNRRKGDT